MVREYRLNKYGTKEVTAVLNNGTLLSIIMVENNDAYDIALGASWFSPDDVNDSMVYEYYVLPEEVRNLSTVPGMDEYSIEISPIDLHKVMVLLDDYDISKLTPFEYPEE